MTRLFQGVASTLLGKSAFGGGSRTALIGVLMHFGVAFAWSAIFVILAMFSASIRRVIAFRRGVIGAAIVYGLFVWLVMSLIVVPFPAASAACDQQPLVDSLDRASDLRRPSDRRVDRAQSAVVAHSGSRAGPGEPLPPLTFRSATIFDDC